MGEDYRHDVFISHSSHDRPVAARLHERLAEDGFEVWRDATDLQPGDGLLTVIGEALRSSRKVLLIWSDHSAGSEWARLEWQTVLAVELADHQPRLVLWVLDDTPLPDLLKGRLYADGRRGVDAEYGRLVRSLRGVEPAPAANRRRDEPDFRADLARYCDALVADLDRYDSEVRWHDRALTPLEAEVEVDRGGRGHRRLCRDLVAGLQSDRHSRTILVRGDPGSGKSVSLRRLVRRLCADAGRHGVVPLYANLREYPAGEAVTPNGLGAFLAAQVEAQTGRDGRLFIDGYYDELRHARRLSVVLDSFDELPQVLDCDEHTARHAEVSRAFSQFFAQELGGNRVVLASRFHRAPVGLPATVVDVRPFTETQVRRAMRGWLSGRGVDADDYVWRLFSARPQLLPHLRNPLTAELIAEYGQAVGGELPDSLLAVYDSLVQRRLLEQAGDLAEAAVEPMAARLAARRIAVGMFEHGTTGLEMPLAEVLRLAAGDTLTEPQGRAVVEALRRGRLARASANGSRPFAFVHRRFAEYLVAADLRGRPGGLQARLAAIPSDSRWREALLMACGVATLAERQPVAEYCWSIVSAAAPALLAGQVAEAGDALHCGRFLVEGFAADAEATAGIRQPLGELVVEMLSAQDLLVAKLGTELIPLAEGAAQQQAVRLACASDRAWVREAALRACRYVPGLDDDAYAAIHKHLAVLPYDQLPARLGDLWFGLGLSDRLRGLRQVLVRRIALAAIAPVFVVLSWLVAEPAARRSGVVTWLQLVPIWALTVTTTPRGRIATRPSLVRDVVMYPWTWLMLGFLVAVRSTDAEPDPMPRFGLLVLLLAALLWLGNPAPRRQRVARRPSRLTSERPGQPLPSGRTRHHAAVSSADRRDLRILLLLAVGAGLMEWLAHLLPRTASYLNVGTLTLAAVVCVPWAAWHLLQDALTAAGKRYRTVSDWCRLRRLGLPEAVTCDVVYRQCRSFASPWGRAAYLDRIRALRRPLVGDYLDPPAELLAEADVNEALGRLREQWLAT